MNINPLTIWLLRSPLHVLLDRSTLLISYQGRVSGRQITVPVNYVRVGEQVLVLTLRRRTWWRGFYPGGPATLRLKGRDVPAHGEAMLEVEQMLPGFGVFVKEMPQVARYLKIDLDEQGEPDPEALREAAEGRVLVRFTL
jgi:hypothetical protein